MKTFTVILTTLAGVVTTSTVLAQGGPLTPPPGAPAPTMKSLDLVEPRVPLVDGAPGVAIGNFGAITISQPGSYYLTGNLQITGNAFGVLIDASGVSLDLMGYSIIASSSGNALNAITVNAGHTNIRIHNGHILSNTTYAGDSFTSSGFDFGILASGTRSVIISNITVRGSRNDGIAVTGPGSIVEKCSVFIASGGGIINSNGTVVDCVVHTTGFAGISAAAVSNCRVDHSYGTGIIAHTVSNSYAQSVSSGFNGIGATTVENSVGITPGLHGIFATTVSNSRGQSTNMAFPGNGINAPGGQVSGSRGEAAGGHGISADSVSNSVGSSSGAHGISSSGISAHRVSNSQGFATNASGGSGISGSFSVTASYGDSSARQGLYSTEGTVSDSFGISSGNIAFARGIDAYIVANSSGRSTHASGGHGITASILAMNSSGTSSGASGVFAVRAVTNCYGFTSHPANNSHGISSSGTVTSSYGWSIGSGSGDGIRGNVVIGSYGYAAAEARHGISAEDILESSTGWRASSEPDRFGIVANRASLSRGINGENITHRYNMP